MPEIITDVFVTVKDRFHLAERSLRSLLDNTDRTHYRLTACLDGGGRGPGSFQTLLSEADYVLEARSNEGLGPTINRAVTHIASIDRWYSDVRCPVPELVAPLITMVQDDVLYSPDWLPRLSMAFHRFKGTHRLGFATGHEAVEHTRDRVPLPQAGPDAFLCPDIRATMMMGTAEYWSSLTPIPRFDPETGRERGRPHDGIGSSCDWWLLRNHQWSVRRTGRTCLVVPGLVRHIGYRESTWLSRDLPESQRDVLAMDARPTGADRVEAHVVVEGAAL